MGVRLLYRAKCKTLKGEVKILKLRDKKCYLNYTRYYKKINFQA